MSLMQALFHFYFPALKKRNRLGFSRLLLKTLFPCNQVLPPTPAKPAAAPGMCCCRSSALHLPAACLIATSFPERGPSLPDAAGEGEQEQKCCSGDEAHLLLQPEQESSGCDATVTDVAGVGARRGLKDGIFRKHFSRGSQEEQIDAHIHFIPN